MCSPLTPCLLISVIAVLPTVLEAKVYSLAMRILTALAFATKNTTDLDLYVIKSVKRITVDQILTSSKFLGKPVFKIMHTMCLNYSFK